MVAQLATVALQPEGPEINSWSGVILHGVCMFSLWMCRFSLGTPASSHSRKRCVLPCDRQATCPGCTPPLTQLPLEVETTATTHAQAGKNDGWINDVVIVF
ncbi:hypothetical protein AMECASPLE_019588 [Ameca splendens]|uniref:Uncharacterized protein n=1 Tax=Ameca splendens TaxID=208324 RepID=A0ABV0ZDK1_9TELE